MRLKVLIVEDDDGVGIVLARKIGMIRRGFPDAEIVIVTTLAAMKEHLRGVPLPDIAIIDLTLPDSDLVNTFCEARIVDKSVPVVIFTGNPNDARKQLKDGDEMEIVEKTPDAFTGSRLFLAMMRAWSRVTGRDQSERLKENIRVMRELLSSDGHPTT